YHRVVAVDACDHHQHRLHDHRVDLAGHDARARLRLRQAQLAETSDWPRAHETNVRSDLPQARADRAERAMRGDQDVERGLGMEVVGRLFDHNPARFGEPRGGDACILRVRVEAGADSGSAERYTRKLVDRAAGATDGFFDLTRVALELLAQADRRCVLQVRAAGLDHRPELLALGLEYALEPLERGHELVLDGHRGRKLNRGRDDIVRGLTEVDVVVGMDELGPSLAAEDLSRPVGDHLVGVGVRRGRGA